jgi:hypothetical protein
VLIDEGVVTLLRRRVRGLLWSWLWVGAVGVCGMFVAPLFLTAGLLLPVFKMSATVK